MEYKVVDVPGSALLWDMVHDAEEAGRDVTVNTDQDYWDVISSVILDGVEYCNGEYLDELESYEAWRRTQGRWC